MTISELNLDLSRKNLLKGAAAGWIATIPMTISMLIGWMLLPERERYALPPRQIVGKLAERLGQEEKLSDDSLLGITLFSHFLYGAMAGSIYTSLEHKVPLKNSMKGGLAGLLLWAGSYLGWLPVVGILKPATQHPWRRNVLMIVAHLVWGVTLGKVLGKFRSDKRYIEL
jgi:putative membrane protein